MAHLARILFFILVFFVAHLRAEEQRCLSPQSTQAQVNDLTLANCIQVCQLVSDRKDVGANNHFRKNCEQEITRRQREGISGFLTTTSEILDDAFLKCLPLSVKKTYESILAIPSLLSYGVERLIALQAKNQLPEEFKITIAECDKNPDCKRALARQLVQYRNQTSPGQWAVSDQQMDSQIKSMRVWDLLAMIPEHRRKIRDECSRDLKQLRAKNEYRDQLENPHTHEKIREELAKKAWDCPGLLKLYPTKVQPKISKEEEKTVPSKIDRLTIAEQIAVGQYCLGPEIGIDLCGEIVSSVIPIPVAEAAALASNGVRSAARFTNQELKLAGNELRAAEINRVTNPAIRTGGQEISAVERDFAGSSARDSAAATKALAKSEIEIKRNTLVQKYEQIAITTEKQNSNWIKLAQSSKPNGYLYLDVENSVLKPMNDVIIKDKALVTAMTNRHKEIVIENVEKLLKKYPEIKVERYSDFKSLRFAFREPTPPNFKSELSEAFKSSNQTFKNELVEMGLIKAEVKAENWMRAGLGETADQATSAARYARQMSSENRIWNYSDSSVKADLGTILKASEDARTDMAKSIGKTHPELLDSVPGSQAQIPNIDVIDIVRKEKTAEKIQAAIENKYGKPISPKQVQDLTDYLNFVDEFSPGIHVAKREVATLREATHGGISIDFAGMGAHNQQATAKALATAEDIDHALVSAREGEKHVTNLFQAKMQERQSAIQNYFENNVTTKGLKIICSGDDCIVQMPRTISSSQRDAIVRSLSKAEQPAGIRMSFVTEKVTNAEHRSVLAAHGELIEKATRAELLKAATVVSPDKLKNILMAVEMGGSQTGAGPVRLIIGSEKTALTQAEKEAIDQSFKKAVEKFNSSLGATGSAGQYKTSAGSI